MCGILRRCDRRAIGGDVVVNGRRSSGVLAVITARAGSKGIVGKNITPLAGRPLIVWTLRAAEEATLLDRVVVSTDGERIAAIVAEASTIEILDRPAELARDDTPHVDVLLHVLNELATNGAEAPSYVVLLQPTSPLRTGGDIDEAILLAQALAAPAVVAVSEAKTHPLMTYRLDEADRLVPFVNAENPEIEYRRRQALPPVYAPNGAVYVVRTDVLRKEKTLYPSGTVGMRMPQERSLDVDTTLDLRVAEVLIEQERKP